MPSLLPGKPGPKFVEATARNQRRHHHNSSTSTDASASVKNAPPGPDAPCAPLCECDGLTVSEAVGDVVPVTDGVPVLGGVTDGEPVCVAVLVGV